MTSRWRQNWFLLALVAVLGGGLAAGIGELRAARLLADTRSPALATALALFLMAWTLDSSRLRDAVRRPAAAIWGAVVNLGLLPVLATVCAWSLEPRDFRLGLVLTAIAPATLATASVFTRRAGGNDAIALLVTLATNVACVVVTPLWLRGIVSSHAEMRTAPVVLQLALCVLVPTMLGQLWRLTALGRAVADRHRVAIGVGAQLLVLAIVATAAISAGLELRRHPAWPAAGDVAAMAATCGLVHVAGLAAGWYGGALWTLPPEDRIATAIAGSQKTLPVSLLITTHPSVAPADAPFVIFPLLTYHALQLLLDAAVADAWRRRRRA